MLQGLRVALAATILAAFLHTSAATPARAELSAEMLGKIEAAVQHDTNAAVVAALQGLFAANPSLAPEIAAATVEFTPGLSRACALAAARAVPNRIFEVVKAMVGEAPERANDVIAGVSEGLPGISDLVAAVVAQAAVGTSAGPASDPFSSPDETSEDGGEDRASPS